MKLRERIGANVRTGREWRGLARAALAARCGLTEDELAEIERGEADLELEKLLMIAAVLGTTPSGLCRGVRWDQDSLRFVVLPPSAAA